MQIRIETPDFIARSLQRADVTQDFAQWFNAPRLLQALKLPRPQLSLERLQALVASFNQAQHFLIGVGHADERPVLGVYHFHVIPQHRTATMAFGGDTRQPDVDQLLQQSCDPLCDYFFEHGLVDKISAHVVSNNPEQLQTLNQCGRWVAEATLQQEILAQDGTRLDLAVLSCFKDAPL